MEEFLLQLGYGDDAICTAFARTINDAFLSKKGIYWYKTKA